MWHVIPLRALGSEQRRSAGNKAAALARLAAAGFLVPPTLVVMQSGAEQAKFTPEEIEAACAALPMLQRFLARHGDGTFAVRSSSRLEDAPHASHAGEFQTYLHVSAAEVPRAIIACLTAMQQPAAPPPWHDAAPGAVLVQPMIAAIAAGVVFTRTTPEAVVSAGSLLLAEWSAESESSVTSGRGLPQRTAVAHQALHAPGARRLARLLAASRPPGSAARFRTFLRRCLDVEASFGRPQDIEWAFDSRLFWFLQARPITADLSPLALQAAAAGSPRPAPPPPAALRGVWSRALCEELWDEPMTPLTASIIVDRLAPRFTFPTALRLLGLRRLSRRPALRVFDHYLYLDCRLIAEVRRGFFPLLELDEVRGIMPSPQAAAATTTGPARPHPPRPPWGSLLRAGLGLALLQLLQPYARFLTAHRRIRSWLSADTERTRRLQRAVREARRGAAGIEARIETIATLQEVSQWAYLHAMLATWVLKALTSRLGDAALVLALIERLPEHATLRANRDLAGLLDLVADSAGRTLPALGATPGSPSAPPPESKPVLATAVEDYLARHGSRSPHRDLAQPRWHEQPALLWETVNSLRALRGERKTPAGQTAGGGAPVARLVERRLCEQAPWPKRALLAWLFRRLLGWTRRYLALREDLRAALDRRLDLLRQDLLDLGRGLVARGALRQPDDVFFLHLDEAEALHAASGLASQAAPELAATIAARRVAFATASARRPPYFIRPEGAAAATPGAGESGAEPRTSLLNSAAGARLSGIGVSRGRRGGVARVVRRWDELEEVRPGDVLVAPHIDPSWTPYFAHVAAVVAEAGGLLSHGAIMARELGLPMVVGVRRATELLRNGDPLEVDGERGTISLSPQAPRQEGAQPTASRREESPRQGEAPPRRQG
ncbi:MAG: hypothetical protein HYY96_01440 [Candidatus Tectomicrobia bacterium]|nr:hypothetical protein [Candidatus Tectomicrobia bacterium]